MKDNKITVRFSNDELEKINEVAKQKKIKTATLIRNITLSSLTNQELLSEKDELRDFIIKTIEESSDKKLGRIISLIFRATSKIEEVFEQNDLFYQNTRDFYNWEYDKKEYINRNYYHPISELAMEFIKERDEERMKNRIKSD
ncbi:MAG: hypothetical protein PHN42_00725 [Bacilli bacterium]|nr:hypothetical protein [Bacilli bacterium]MDD3452789.1 hypothetical protein [Bacilli bacterium]